ncbi:transposon Ty3-I Gag-Pol polyprotein [Trichonephila clavipes]|nr:transposon Ty3-I Gag-Pol polyprotein [Trichonephila clavipes]
MQLSNVYFFLDGTVRKWYENNKDSFTSWTLLENGLKAAFGGTQTYVRRARDCLESRTQPPGECIQSYVQEVLELCQQTEPNVSEEVSHLMKGVTEDLFQALLARDVQTSGDYLVPLHGRNEAEGSEKLQIRKTTQCCPHSGQ